MPEEEFLELEVPKPTLEAGRYFKQEDYQALQIEIGKLISIVSNRFEVDEELANITYTLQEVLEIPESVHYTVYEWLEQLTDY